MVENCPICGELLDSESWIDKHVEDEHPDWEKFAYLAYQKKENTDG